MMGTLERTTTLSEPVGPAGRVSVKTVTGTVRVRAVAGTDARVTVHYRVRASDRPAAERALEDNQVRVERGDGWLSIESAERRLSGLGWLLGGIRVVADIDLELPPGTALRAETVSGRIEGIALAGEQRYRTVSGDVSLSGVAGGVDASTVSGSIDLYHGGEVGLKAGSVSGAIKADAALFRTLRLNTTSGRASVRGPLDGAGDHRADSVSGDLELTTTSGLTAEAKTMSGGIRCQGEHRLEGGRGLWRAVVGDGSARLRFNSISGQLRLFAAGSAADAAPESFASPAAAPTPAEAPGADEWRPETEPLGADGAPAGVPEAGVATADADQLEVLRALERGEIDVEEAAARLEAARAAAGEVSGRAG